MGGQKGTECPPLAELEYHWIYFTYIDKGKGKWALKRGRALEFPNL